MSNLELTQNQKNMLSAKTRLLTLVTYLDENKVVQLLTESPHIVDWAYAYHDKDIFPDGSAKKTHCHIILHLDDVYTLRTYAELFETTQVTKLNKAGVYTMFEYLIHNTDTARNEGKHEYDSSIRITNNLDYFKRKEKKHALSVSEIFKDFDNKTSFREMACKYGYAFVVNYKKFSDYYAYIQQQEHKYEKKKSTKIPKYYDLENGCLVEESEILDTAKKIQNFSQITIDNLKN